MIAYGVPTETPARSPCPGVDNLQRAGLVQRMGKGIKGNPYLYFAGNK